MLESVVAGLGVSSVLDFSLGHFNDYQSDQVSEIAPHNYSVLTLTYMALTHHLPLKQQCKISVLLLTSTISLQFTL